MTSRRWSVLQSRRREACDFRRFVLCHRDRRLAGERGVRPQRYSYYKGQITCVRFNMGWYLSGR